MNTADSKRRMALVTLIAFLFHAIVPFFALYQTPQAHNPATQQLASLFGDKIFICTQSGFQWVTLEELKQGKEIPAPHKQIQCALCYVAAHGIKDASPMHAAALLLPVPRQVATISFSFDPVYHPRWTRSSVCSRAPPIFS